MDRATSTPRRRPRFLLGFGLLFLGTSHFGCAELKSQIFGDSHIGELGRVESTNDIYAKNTQPRVLMPPPNATTDVTSSTGTLLTEVEEAGPAILPAPNSVASPSISRGVALQTPRPVESNTNFKLTSNTGVPNAAKILASAERKPEVKPEAIVAQARAALDGLTTYEVAMHRQERVNGSLLPEEDLLLAIRRSPRSVRLSWPSGPNQGREVLYRSDEPGGQMHIKMANPALPRLSLNPESPMVMRNSRHPVTEAGFDSLVEGLENGLSVSALTYAGVETPSGLDRPAHCLTRVAPTGENWRVYLDVENHLPALVQAVDARGELLERYVFHDLKANPADLASAEAFDVTSRWGQARGLLGRLARGNDDNAPATPPDSTPR